MEAKHWIKPYFGYWIVGVVVLCLFLELRRELGELECKLDNPHFGLKEIKEEIKEIERSQRPKALSAGPEVEYISPKKTKDHYVYAVKFLCGNPLDESCLKGELFSTSINIQNLSKHKQKLKISISVADSDHPAVGDTKVTLRPNEAVHYDCAAILQIIDNHLPSQSTSFIEGFFSIKAVTANLQVVAVYSFVQQ